MSAWIETELAESPLPDRRHAKRLAQLLERLSEQSVSSIPRACHGWAETRAAYRFLDNPRVGRKEILAGHQHATLERLQAHAGTTVRPPTLCFCVTAEGRDRACRLTGRQRVEPA
jgi:transposase-like protein